MAIGESKIHFPVVMYQCDHGGVGQMITTWENYRGIVPSRSKCPVCGRWMEPSVDIMGAAKHSLVPLR